MQIRKWIALLLAFCMLLALSGCGDTATQSSSETIGEENTESVCTALLQRLQNSDIDSDCDSLCGYYDADFALYFEQLYGLDASYVTDGAIFYVKSGSSADEISILTPADAGKGATVKAALQERASRRSRDFTGYNDAEANKAANASVIQLGSRFALIIGNDPASIAKQLRQLLKS